MDVAKPKESILSLFDPLARPRTPPRNTNSPEEASDKENDVQAGPVTVFFNRIYKAVPSHNGSKTPKGKLIDFGERTPLPPRRGDMLAEEGFDCFAEEDDTLDSPEMSRRPLADIDIERVPRALRRPSTIPEEQDNADESICHALTGAPSASPFANVINSINLSGASSMDFQDPPGPSGAFNCPGITVCPPEPAESTPSRPDSVADNTCGSSFVFLSPTAHTSTPAVSSPGATRRPQTANLTSSADPRRTSVDLQSSFNLLMHSADMSFDLLNDKISFLNASTSSWTIVDADRDDDTFELAKQELRTAKPTDRYMKGLTVNVEEDTLDLAKVQKRMEGSFPRFEPIREESLDYIVVDIPIPRMKELTPPKPAPSIEHTLNRAAPAPTRAPVFSLPPAGPEKSAPTAAPKPDTKPAEPATQIPAPGLPKMTWVAQHDRTSSSTSSSHGSATSAGSRRSSISSSRPTSSTGSVSDLPRPAIPTALKAPARRLSGAAMAPPPAPASKPPVRGVQRPTAGTLPAPAAPTRPTSAVRAPASAKPAAVPKRTPAPDAAAQTKPVTGAKPVLSAPASRLQRPAAGAIPARSADSSAKLPVSGLRPPASSIPSALPGPGLPAPKSGLPRPASRLPAPTKSAFGGTRRL